MKIRDAAGPAPLSTASRADQPAARMRKLTYRFGGRDMRLTDVHGELVEKALA